MKTGPNCDGKTQLLHPFFCHRPLSSTRIVLDFNKLSVLHLRQMFYTYHCTLRSQNRHAFFLKLCVTTCQGEQPLVFLTTDLYGIRIMFRCGDDRSKTIPNMSTFYGSYVCDFKGRPSMVYKTGRTVMIGRLEL